MEKPSAVCRNFGHLYGKFKYYDAGFTESMHVHVSLDNNWGYIRIGQTERKRKGRS